MITFRIIVKLKTKIVKLSYLIHIVHNCAQLFHDMYCHENTMMFVVVITTTVVIFIITIGFNNAGEPTMSVACATYYRVWGAERAITPDVLLVLTIYSFADCFIDNKLDRVLNLWSPKPSEN